MKIAIYGVSRAGKNYLIERIVKQLNSGDQKRAFHLEGSTTLNILAKKAHNTSFKMLTEEEKDQLRRTFTELIRQKEAEYEVVFVDGHYAFIDDAGFRVVFTEEDRNIYDTFFYLDTPAEMIVQFSQNSQGDKKNTEITAEEVRLWKSFEKEQMAKICSDLNKELIILDEDTSACIEFIESYVTDTDGHRYEPKKVAKTFIDSILKDRELPKKIFVMDCDKTLSENDVTYEFCQQLGIDGRQLKQIFRNDRYTAYQFFKVAKLYGSKSFAEIKRAAIKAKGTLKLSTSVLSDISKNTKDSYRLGITSGVYHIWQLFLEEQMFDSLIGCAEIHDMKGLITPSVKKEVTSLLRKMGKTVIAIGDSVIDIPMLEAADNGYIVAHEKLSAAVITHFDRFPDTTIKQVSYSNHKYAGVEVVEGIL